MDPVCLTIISALGTTVLGLGAYIKQLHRDLRQQLRDELEHARLIQERVEKDRDAMAARLDSLLGRIGRAHAQELD